ncbi:MAG: septum formation protein Maf [Sphingobacteriales bacterium 17-39-43]|uniref:Maf family protein n=1 Tax=Daejeonella sp. TaxID=2805397 RepID=UPI000BC52B44|nr:Maf family nucleotide pyrophosphatase [Daejeonella sp.]OYZ30406.1 MAG: septum formation protein Maf [Sphingobacteriales bacterium 16-39-50]OZA23024.1 MAG: septum formation protein Maf [Sphingobacteriales bacterium 17-39-43]OZA60782.1 MAG: septum formation protein Maf [Sphingobacteriales bacterium 39-40-5]HQS05288.1 Maf family nucleotide pyrophosphatase [Daejeonella sp.]HQS51312.1 Maf family nucleotide pyrophosphatase [Daejeonella sp.]
MIKQFPPIILASKSPRRQELLKLMGFDFQVVLREVDESYPEGLSPSEIAVYISEKKARAFDLMIENEIVITADTIVSLDGNILGKPENEDHAFEMLSELSGKRHDVITGVSLLKDHKLSSFYELTEVFFKEISAEQIRYYINTCQPMDKAGAYGIQEWIGLVAVDRINGSYSNVVGLPTHRLYAELCKLSE